MEELDNNNKEQAETLADAGRDEELLVDFEIDIEVDDIFDDGESVEKTRVISKEALKDGLEGGASMDDTVSRGKPAVDEEEEIRSDLIDIDRERKKHRKKHFFLQTGFTVVALTLLIAILLSPLFRIKNVEVEGNKYYSDKEVISMAEPAVGKNIFISAQKSRIKKALMKDPYFESVKVSRKLPGTLLIKVKEKEQLAALKYGDRYVVIDSDERVLRIADIDPEVTIIEGLTIKKMDVGEKIDVEESAVFSDTVETLDIMKEGDLYFKHITVTKSEVNAYIYDLLKVRGSSDQLKRAIESGNLKKVVNKLMKSKIKHGTINIGDGDYISFSPAI